MPRATKKAAAATQSAVTTEQPPVAAVPTEVVLEAPVESAETEDPTTETVVLEETVQEEAAPPAKSKQRAAIALKCSVNQAALKAALEQVRGSLPTRKSLPNPTIGNYKLTADRGAKTLAITTYNEVVATTVTIPANVVAEGTLLVSKDLGDLVAMLPDSGITLSAETPSKLQVVMDSRTFSPKSMSAAGYPELLTLDEVAGDETDGMTRYAVATEAFRRALEFVCPGALTEGSDAETSILNSVRLDLWHGRKGDVFAVAASDNSCLMVDEATALGDATLDLKSPALTACIPVKSLQILSRLLEESESETLDLCFPAASSGSHTTLCLFQGGGKQLLTHLVTNEWHDYRQHIPKQEHFRIQVIADRELLLSLVSCNLVFAIAKTLRTMILDVSSQPGVLSTWVKTQSKGESLQEMVATVNPLHGADRSALKPLGFNAAQVRLALGLFRDTEIWWQFIEAQAPTLMSGGTKGRWLILMPISVNDDSEADAVPATVEPTTKKTTRK